MATVPMRVIDVLHDLGFGWIEAAGSVTGPKMLHLDARSDLLVSDAGRSVRPGLLVLFITRYAENALLNNAYLDPGMAVLAKPFLMEAMAAHIRSTAEAGGGDTARSSAASRHPR